VHIWCIVQRKLDISGQVGEDGNILLVRIINPSLWWNSPFMHQDDEE